MKAYRRYLRFDLKIGIIILLAMTVIIMALDSGCISRRDSPTPTETASPTPTGLPIIETPSPTATVVTLSPAITLPSETVIPDPPLTTYVIPAITNIKFLPNSIMPDKYLSNQITLQAAPSEFEPASFIILATRDIKGLEVTATQLTSGEKVFNAENIDIRVVKSWYQAGDGNDVWGKNLQGKFITPELLLKDDSLVKVENEENYLKLTTGKYTWISEKKAVQISPIPVTDMPVKDSPVLLPVDIPRETIKQFWVTVKIPESQPAGVYTGKLRLRNALGLLGEIQIQVEVLPFKLLYPMLTYSLYYPGILDARWPQGSISHLYKSEEQFRAEMKNLLDHGVKYPTINDNPNLTLLARALTIRAEVGISNQLVYLMQHIGNSNNANELVSLKNNAKAMIEFIQRNGGGDVYFYGLDEAEGSLLTSQIPAWQTIHEAGGRIFASGKQDSNFSAIGNIQDLLICSGTPSAKEAAKWHSVGHKIFSYANPQVGVEKPGTYRYNYGLLLWQRDYDGAMNFAYQWDAKTNIWNDFDSPEFRDHNFTYPTMNGVIDTIQWEGWREGVDDIRYLTNLLETIKTAKTKGRDCSEAEKWLAGLKTQDLREQNLDIVRATMVKYILTLS